MNAIPKKSEKKPPDEFTDLKKKWTKVNQKINKLTEIQRYSTFEKKIQELIGLPASEKNRNHLSLCKLHRQTRDLAEKYNSQAMNMIFPEEMETTAILSLLKQHSFSDSESKMVFGDRDDPEDFSDTFLFSRNADLDEPGYPFTAPLIDKLITAEKKVKDKLAAYRKEISQGIELRRKAARLRKFYLFVDSPLTRGKHPARMKTIHLELILYLDPRKQDHENLCTALMKRFESLYPESYETLYRLSSDSHKIIQKKTGAKAPKYKLSDLFLFGNSFIRSIINEISGKQLHVTEKEINRIINKTAEIFTLRFSNDNVMRMFRNWLNSRLEMLEKLKNRQLEEYVPVKARLCAEITLILYYKEVRRGRELYELLKQDRTEPTTPEDKLASHLESLYEASRSPNIDPRVLILFGAKYGWFKRDILSDAAFPLAGIKKSRGSELISRFEGELSEKTGRENFDCNFYSADLSNERISRMLERLLIEAHNSIEEKFSIQLDKIATKLAELNSIFKENRKFTSEQVEAYRLDRDSDAVKAVTALIQKVCSGATGINLSSIGQDIKTNVRNKDKKAIQYFLASWSARWLEYTANDWYDNGQYPEEKYNKIIDRMIERKKEPVTEKDLLELMEWCGEKYKDITEKNLSLIKDINGTSYLQELNKIDKKTPDVEKKMTEMESKCAKMFRNVCRLHHNPKNRPSSGKKLPPKEPAFFPGTMAIHLFLPNDYPLVSKPVIKALAYYRNLHRGEKAARKAWKNASIDPQSPESWRQVTDYRKFWFAVKETCTKNIRVFDRFMHGTNNHLRETGEGNKGSE